MALSTAASQRRLKGRRNINAQLSTLCNGLLPAGRPIPGILLSQIVDERFEIVEACAGTTAMPCPGQCCRCVDVQARSVELNRLEGFRKASKERVDRARVCTHMSKPAELPPAAVLQAFHEEALNTRRGGAHTMPLFQFDRRHALLANIASAQTNYPR